MSISKAEYERLGLGAFLKNDITKKLKQSGKELKKSHQVMREEGLADVWERGGKGFVERIRAYGRTEADSEIIVDEHFAELLETLGDFRVAKTITTGCAQSGKCQPLDAKIATPNGWVKMGDIKVGDLVIARDGRPTEVIGVYPQGEKPIYRVTMDDDSSTECCDEHLWYTQVAMDRGRKYAPLHELTKSHGTRQRDWEPTEYGDRPGSVKTLREIMDTLYQVDKNGEKKRQRGKLRSNHSIPLCKPIQYETKYFDVHPYLMGALIGDGCLRNDVGFSTKDKEILDRIYHLLPDGIEISSKGDDKDYGFVRSKGLGKNVLLRSLKEIGIFGHKSNSKFIPDIYKFGDINQRLDLLRGLMDTDGTCAPGGNIEFGSVSRKLVEDVRELVLSLGGKTNLIRVKKTFYKKDGVKVPCQDFYRLSFKINFNPFYLSRKYDLWKETSPKTFRRYIRTVEYVGKKESQCIAVAHPDHLYLTDEFIVTHNTLGNMLLLVDTLVYLRCRTAFFFDSQVNLRNNCPIQFQPMAENYVKALEKAGVATYDRSQDRMMLERYQISGVTANFSYTSTNKSGGSKESSGRAAVGGVAASFTADILFGDEVSQWEPGAYDPLPRRIDASVISSRPQRLLGTPGSSGGIERFIKEMDVNMYPHVECNHCGEVFPLDPKGCLFKAYEREDSSGNKVIAYLTEAGRPNTWWCYDENDPVNTAYIGCPHCGHEIDDETRYNAHYRCLTTGVWLRDWLDAIPKGIPQKTFSAALHITPLTRRSKTNLAAQIVRTGLEAVDPRDFQQQALGHPSENIVNSLTMQILERSIKAPPPERIPDFRLAGIDQGRSAYFMACADYQLPQGWRTMPTEEVIANTIRQYIFLGELPASNVPSKLKELGVTMAVCDQEPDRTRAAELQRTTVIELGDQISKLSDAVRKSTVEEGGAILPVWKFRNEKFLAQFMNSFVTSHKGDGWPLARLPNQFERWIHVPTDASPLRHLQAIHYDPYTDKWISRDPNNDLAYASMFMEVAFYLNLTQSMNNTYTPGNLVTVEKPAATSSYAPLGYGQPRGGRRGSFIPSRSRRGY